MIEPSNVKGTQIQVRDAHTEEYRSLCRFSIFPDAVIGKRIRKIYNIPELHLEIIIL